MIWRNTLCVFRLSVSLTCLVVLLSFPSCSIQASAVGRRTLPELSTSEMLYLVSLRDPLKNLDPSNSSSHLSKILIPRAPGTPNNTIVKDYIVSTLKALNWHVEEDSFTDTTPIGTKLFTNVIATKDPTASRRVVLSAHFDSKYFASHPWNQFVGATDSAAPCAMMLDLAETLDPLLDHRRERLEQGLEDDEDISDTTLQLVFFDGEEAFVQWTDTDSLYGSRHLAQKWSTAYVTPHTKRRLINTSGFTEISLIEHLILLDLLGAPNPTMRSYFIDTAWLFDALVSAEERLGRSGAFDHSREKGVEKWNSFFLKRTGYESNVRFVEDDQVPFLQLGVSVLHIIAEPFPSVWHTIKDDASALDLPTLRRWNLILRVFMSEYLNLRPTLGTQHATARNVADPVRRSEVELASLAKD